jgi:segregation and condensation protein B
MLDLETLPKIIEAALMVAGRPLTVLQLQKLFDEDEQPSTAEIKLALSTLKETYLNRGVYLTEVASGFQFQAKKEFSTQLSKLWEERPPRYTRALLETLSLIAYRQPVTRAEIENIRGVTVSSNITKTLSERDWIKVIGYREVPGRPALYGTTKNFLDHFNLKNLSELPTLAEIKDLESQEAKLNVEIEMTNEELQIDEALEDFNDAEILSNESDDQDTTQPHQKEKSTES